MNPVVLVLYWGHFAALVGIGVYATTRGREPEQIVGFLMISTWLLDGLNHALFGRPAFFTVNPGHFVLDSWEMVGLMAVALYANRGWPLWVASLQIIVMLGHAAKFADASAVRRAYWAMIAVPGYVQELVLLLGVIAHDRRQRRIGAYPCWRPQLAPLPQPS